MDINFKAMAPKCILSLIYEKKLANVLFRQKNQYSTLFPKLIREMPIITTTGAKSFQEKKNRVTGYASYFCAKSSPIKLLHVNMYANFLTVPSSARYCCPNSSHIKPNHVKTTCTVSKTIPHL